MLRLTFQVFVVIYIATCSLGQYDKFEYECHILEKLDTLENDLKAAKEDQVASKAQLEHLKSELADAKTAQAASDTALQEAKDAIAALNQQLQASGGGSSGSTYVRWGRTTCPGNGTELVYPGFAGGSHYSHTGAASKMLCLPEMPKYGSYYEDARQSGGLVFGTEYQFNYRVNGMNFFPGVNSTPFLHEHNVPCAVCRTYRPTVLMVPAWNTCMDGWTLEYKGMLFSGYFNHSGATEYICLDERPEVIAGGEANENGRLLYFVEVRCGSLSCDNYVNGRELTCAVCSK